MRKYSEHIIYVVYRNPLTDQRYAVDVADAIEIEKHYSDMDHFLYAPDDLFVEGIPVSYERKNGIMNLDYEHKIKLKVKILVNAWVTISDE